MDHPTRNSDRLVLPFMPAPFLMYSSNTASNPLQPNSKIAIATNLFPSETIRSSSPVHIVTDPNAILSAEASSFYQPNDRVESSFSDSVKRTSNFVGVHWHRGAGTCLLILSLVLQPCSDLHYFHQRPKANGLLK